MSGITFITLDASTTDDLVIARCVATGAGAENWQHHVDTWRESLDWAAELLGESLTELEPGISTGRGAGLEMSAKLCCVALARWNSDRANRKAIKEGELKVVNAALPKGAIKTARLWHRARYENAE